VLDPVRGRGQAGSSVENVFDLGALSTRLRSAFIDLFPVLKGSVRLEFHFDARDHGVGEDSLVGGVLVGV
jgi:hypothetical protein